jgi:hypothetical protein
MSKLDALIQSKQERTNRLTDQFNKLESMHAEAKKHQGIRIGGKTYYFLKLFVSFGLGLVFLAITYFLYADPDRLFSFQSVHAVIPDNIGSEYLELIPEQYRDLAAQKLEQQGSQEIEAAVEDVEAQLNAQFESSRNALLKSLAAITLIMGLGFIYSAYQTMKVRKRSKILYKVEKLANEMMNTLAMLKREEQLELGVLKDLQKDPNRPATKSRTFHRRPGYLGDEAKEDE